MDLLFDSHFISALFAIVVIDLVLAGDNAIVIALAARNVPRHLQRRAIIWGTVGAIVVRSSLTMLVVWLLRIPGLMLVGGGLLVWIAWHLLTPEAPRDEEVASASSFWGAMRTIVVADALMGLDNVLAVAGAAHGSFLLVGLGLLISIPIMIWGSTLVLRFIEHFPAFVYFGAGILAWTAVKMITHEPMIQGVLHATPHIVPLLYVTVVGGVVWSGLRRKHFQLESRISQRIIRLRTTLAQQTGETGLPEHDDVKGEHTMLKILVPVDDSSNARHALRQVINEFIANPAMEIHLLNVQPRLSRHIGRFLSRSTRETWHRDQAEKALAPAREMLAKHSIPVAEHVELGRRAETIVAVAKRLRCDHIVMGTARKNSLTRMIESSTTNRVLELTRIPVEVVAGDAISPLERYGLPAGLGALLTLLVFSID
ncbi:MAG TPA: YjbE family putative metal transport protein [Rhodocyclaceae bacterium]|nr:YjbE family putative metal transport protein [Rhodocyclaceae bacterium]